MVNPIPYNTENRKMCVARIVVLQCTQVACQYLIGLRLFFLKKRHYSHVAVSSRVSLIRTVFQTMPHFFPSSSG